MSEGRHGTYAHACDSACGRRPSVVERVQVTLKQASLVVAPGWRGWTVAEGDAVAARGQREGPGGRRVVRGPGRRRSKTADAVAAVVRLALTHQLQMERQAQLEELRAASSD